MLAIWNFSTGYQILGVLHNEDGELVEVQRIRGRAEASTIGPYVITVDPATLDRP